MSIVQNTYICIRYYYLLFVLSYNVHDAVKINPYYMCVLIDCHRCSSYADHRNNAFNIDDYYYYSAALHTQHTYTDTARHRNERFI